MIHKKPRPDSTERESALELDEMWGNLKAEEKRIQRLRENWPDVRRMLANARADYCIDIKSGNFEWNRGDLPPEDDAAAVCNQERDAMKSLLQWAMLRHLERFGVAWSPREVR